MYPADFQQKNRVFTAPKDMTKEQIGDLPTWVGKDKSHGMPVVRSLWQPTPEEVQDIVAGKGVFLDILGTSMPPVSLYTQDPFDGTE